MYVWGLFKVLGIDLRAVGLRAVGLRAVRLRAVGLRAADHVPHLRVCDAGFSRVQGCRSLSAWFRGADHSSPCYRP